MFVGKVGAYLLVEQLEYTFTWVGGLSYNHWTRMERPARDKHSCLLRKFVNYVRKKLYNIGTCLQKRKSKFTFKKFYSKSHKYKKLWDKLIFIAKWLVSLLEPFSYLVQKWSSLHKEWVNLLPKRFWYDWVREPLLFKNWNNLIKLFWKKACLINGTIFSVARKWSSLRQELLNLHPKCF